MPRTQAERTKPSAKSNVERVVARLNQQYGKGTVLHGSEMQFPKIPRLSTGIYALDVALGGGWPRGRMNQIHGPESAGKSLIAYLTAAMASRYCMWCTTLLSHCTCGAKEPIMTAWFDVEHTHDPVWARKLGVNLDLLYVVHSEHGAQFVDQAETLIRSGEIGLAIVDSIAALVPAENIEKSAEDGMSPGAIARLMSLATRKWQAALNAKVPHPTQRQTVDGKSVPVMWDNLCTIIGLNQLRESISHVPTPPKPPGGRAWRHALSTDVALSFANDDIEWDEPKRLGDEEEEAPAKKGAKGKKKKMDGEPIEWDAIRQTVHFMTRKNKTFSPRKPGHFRIDFRTAKVDNAVQIVELARRYGVCMKNGSWWSYGDLKAQNKDEFVDVLQSKNMLTKIRTETEKRAYAALEAPKAAAPSA